MANAVVELVGLPTGMTLTATLYPLGSDVAAASGKALTERVNGKGVYRGTVVEGLSGWHRILALSGTDVMAIYDIFMDDTATDHYAYDHEQKDLDAAVSSRSTVTTAQVNAEADQALADYDPPTRAEATADRDTVIAAFPAAPDNAGITQLLLDVAALNNLSAGDVQDALTAQGYTVARAAFLDDVQNADTALTAIQAVVQFLKDIQQGKGSYEGAEKKFVVRHRVTSAELLRKPAYQKDGVSVPVFGGPGPVNVGADEIGA